MTARLLESDVMNACRTLFEPGPDIGRGSFFIYSDAGPSPPFDIAI